MIFFNAVGKTEITQKQVWYLCQGGSIIRTSDSNTLATGEKLINTVTSGNDTVYYISTGIPYKALFKFPVVEVTNVTSTKSGNEAKDLTFEWKGIEQPTQSYMTVEMTTDLAALHIDSTGVDLDSFYPDPEEYPEFATA